MLKAKIISLDNKKEDQRKEESAMTPQQRMNLAFQLIDLAIALSPKGALPKVDDHTIQWIDLKFKDGKC